MSDQPKILYLDIETTPLKVYMWGMYQELTNYDLVIDEWYILSVSMKWANSSKVISLALPDFPLYKKDPKNDTELLLKVRDALNEADIVIWHNGNSFDRCKLNSRFIIQNIAPPHTYRTIDTLLIARKHCAFTSNKLSDLAKVLKIGVKIDTGGFQLWPRCMNGDPAAWKLMRKYNDHDVVLLEKVYLKLRSLMNQHPNMSDLANSKPACPKCGSTNVHRRGFVRLNTGKYVKIQCQSCGGWSRDKVNLLEKGQSKNLLVNA